MAFFNNHPVASVMSATVTIAIIGGLGLIGAGRLSDAVLFHPSTDEPVVEVVATTPVVAMRNTPAETAIQAALAEGPSGWSAQGVIQRADIAPNPYSCPLPGKSPATSISRSFSAAGTPVRVTVAAYTAGLGAEAMTQQNNAVFTCATADSAPGWDRTYGATPGTEAYIAQVTKAGNRIVTASSRRGDVITYITGNNAGVLQNLAVEFDKHLSPIVDPVCTAPSSSIEQSTRSLFSSAGYSPYLVEKNVSIADPGLPRIPTDSKVKSVSLPGPVIDAEEVEQTPTPKWPVWPLQPKLTAFPEAPKSPDAKPVLASVINIEALDAFGPGCGWGFTGMKAPVFNEAAAEAANLKKTDTTENDLTNGAKGWATSVLSYWESYGNYAKDIKAYKTYADKVKEVNKKWAVIADQWGDYEEKMDEWEESEEVRTAFLKEKQEANTSYASELEQCLAEAKTPVVPEPTATPSPSQSAIAKPTPSATPTAQPTKAATTPCEPVRPAILDEEVPESKPKPAEPEDPRPVDER